MSKIALLIGVSDYASGLKPLPAAERDVAALQEVLQHLEIGEFDEVTVLKNPTLLKMRQAISKLYGNRDTEDLVLLYFSGHGLTDMSGKFFLTNCETENQDGLDKATALEASFIHDLMENCDSERQIIILDCCHSGAFPTGMTARSSGTIDFRKQLGGKGRVILTSSAATEYSFERQGEELAVYTRYLVEGIKTGAADLDEDGFISVNELHDYVKNQIHKAVPSMHPERFVFKEGEKIQIAKAITNNSKREYRKFVEQFFEQHNFNGKIHLTERRILDRQYQKLKLYLEEANAIETEVLRPYREHQRNIEEYQECLIAELNHKPSLSNRTIGILETLRKEFNLTDKTITTITNDVLRNLGSKSDIAIEGSSSVAANIPHQSVQLLFEAFNFDVVIINSFAEEVRRFMGQAHCFTEKLNNNLTLEMIYIPKGNFLMGSPKSEGRDSKAKPQHLVAIKHFLISKYPITKAQWEAIAFLREGFQCEHLDLDLDQPMVQISWRDAVEFCVQLSQRTERNYRLPTEAEWEYACRAGTTTPFHFGETITSDLANFDGGCTYRSELKGVNRAKPLRVGSFQYSNTFGLHDMHGNIWEWCQDDWHNNYAGAPITGEAWVDSERSFQRVVRGGSYESHPSKCRSAYRQIADANHKSNNTGFRVVLQLESD